MPKPNTLAAAPHPDAIATDKAAIMKTILQFHACFVGGIIGVFVSSRQSSAAVYQQAVLQFLIMFVFITVIVYSLLLSESKEFGMGYNIAAFLVALSFSV